MDSISNQKLCRDERCGSFTVLMAALVLPLMFFLFSLSLDLSMYHSESQKAQKAADDAALFAYRFLPFAIEAENAARAYLERFEGFSQKAQVTADNHSLSISVKSSVSLHFANLFGVDLQIPLEAFSSVWSSPIDSLLLLDSSSYSSPRPLVAGAWGDQAGWPAAYFFSALKLFYFAGTQVDSRVISQQCFNPLLSALKLAAIKTYDYLAASKLNALGVGFYPGNIGPLDLSREVQIAGERSSGAGEADFISINSSDFAADEYCAAAAELEVDHLAYKLPSHSSAISANFSPLPGLEPMIDQAAWTFNPQYQPYLQARQVIWSRAAQQNETANFPAVLDRARSLLFGASIQSNRRALRDKPRKSLFIFSADVPYSNGDRFSGFSGPVKLALDNSFAALRADLASLGQQSFSIYYLIMRHENEQANLDYLIPELSSYFATQELDQNGNKLAYLSLKVIQAANAEDLSNLVVSSLLLDKRSAVVAR